MNTNSNAVDDGLVSAGGGGRRRGTTKAGATEEENHHEDGATVMNLGRRNRPQQQQQQQGQQSPSAESGAVAAGGGGVRFSVEATAADEVKNKKSINRSNNGKDNSSSSSSSQWSLPYWYDATDPTHGPMLLRATRRRCTHVTLRGCGLSDRHIAPILFELCTGIDPFTGVVNTNKAVSGDTAAAATSVNAAAAAAVYKGFIPSQLTHLDLGNNSLGPLCARVLGQVSCGLIDRRHSKEVLLPGGKKGHHNSRRRGGGVRSRNSGSSGKSSSSRSSSSFHATSTLTADGGYSPTGREDAIAATLLPALTHLDLSDNVKMDHGSLIFLLRCLGRGATLGSNTQEEQTAANKIVPLETLLLHQNNFNTTFLSSSPAEEGEGSETSPPTRRSVVLPRGSRFSTAAASTTIAPSSVGSRGGVGGGVGGGAASASSSSSSSSSLAPFITVSDLPEVLYFILHRNTHYSKQVAKELVSSLVVVAAAARPSRGSSSSASSSSSPTPANPATTAKKPQPSSSS